MFKSGQPQKSQICWRCPSAGTSTSAPQSGPSPRPRRPCSGPRGTASGCQSAPPPRSCSGEGRGLERVHRESVMRTVQCTCASSMRGAGGREFGQGQPRQGDPCPLHPAPVPRPRPRCCIPPVSPHPSCSTLHVLALSQAVNTAERCGFTRN